MAHAWGNQATRVGRRAEDRDVPENWGGQGRLHGGDDGLRDALNVRVRVRGGTPGGSDSLREGKSPCRKVHRDVSAAGSSCQEFETCLGDDGKFLRKAWQKHLF